MEQRKCVECGETFPNNGDYFPYRHEKRVSRKGQIVTYTITYARCRVNGCHKRYVSFRNTLSKQRSKPPVSKVIEDFEGFSFTDDYFAKLTYDDLSKEEKKMFKK